MDNDLKDSLAIADVELSAIKNVISLDEETFNNSLAKITNKDLENYIVEDSTLGSPLFILYHENNH